MRNLSRRLFSLMLLMLLLPGGHTAKAAGTLYDKVYPATLEVLIDGHLAGDGWFASPQGLAFTAAHLIRNFSKIEVLSPVAGRLPAVLVATDLSADLALLRIDRHGRYFPSLPFAEKLPATGEQLFLLGSPQYRHGLFLSGQLARTTPSFEWNDLNRCYTQILPVQALTPEGTSGAPWVNRDGAVVGMQSGMMAWKEQLMGIAFMSPAEAASSLIRDKSNVVMATLGGAFAESWEVSSGMKIKGPGLAVLWVNPGSPLAKAGIKPGDVLLTMNKEPLVYRDQLLEMVRKLQVGSRVQLTVATQTDQPRELTVALGNLAQRL